MLRDDDASFFTAPEVLERAYGPIWRWCPVSLAVIPFAVETRNWGDSARFWQNDTPHPVGENAALVEAIDAWRRKGLVSIIQHGHRHRYLPGPEPATWIPEFVHLEEPRRAIVEGREHLEAAFQVKIRTFTPPSNAISRASYRALRQERMHLTQLHPFRVAGGGTPTWELRGAARRLAARARWRHDYPGVLSFGSHREVTNLPVTPRSNPDGLLEELAFRRRTNGAVCLSTHHWELGAPIHDGSSTVADLLGRCLEWLESNGAEPHTADSLLAS